MKRRNSAFLLLLAAAAFLFTAILVSAADIVPDYSRDGSSSIRVSFEDKETGEAVSGGTLELIQVASLAGDHFEALEEFAAAEIGTALLESESLSDPDLAAKLAAYAGEKGIRGAAVGIDESGKAAYESLPLGVYLVIETEAAEGYQTVRPFLVTIPFLDGDHYIYDVDATPKVGRVSEIEPVTSEVPKIKKVIDVPGNPDELTDTSKEYMAISAFSFEFAALDASYPMPERASEAAASDNGSQDGTAGRLVINVEGAGEYEIGRIAFTRAGDYYYTVTELAGTGNYTYDATKYVLKYSVVRDGDRLTVAEQSIRTGDANGEVVSEAVFTFTNRYRRDFRVDEEEIETHKTVIQLDDEEEENRTNKTNVTIPDESDENPPSKTRRVPDEEESVARVRHNEGEEERETPPPEEQFERVARVTLPQTGQLWWPVWVMAGAGALFLLIGLIRRRSSR